VISVSDDGAAGRKPSYCDTITPASSALTELHLVVAQCYVHLRKIPELSSSSTTENSGLPVWAAQSNKLMHSVFQERELNCTTILRTT